MSTLNDVVKVVPGYADLFGEISLCECDHCESILSPAAYFVDLLQFLSRCPKNAKGRTPLEVLFERRPDLEFILLTCENSNTPLPAIDLANEVLEVIVTLGKVDASAAHDTGSVTAEELAANPQYSIPKARDLLRDAVFPIPLPYDLRLEMARAYLVTLGTTRYELMALLRQDALLPTPLLPTLEAIAAEALAWSKLDFELITGMQFSGASATSGSLEDLYGLDAASLAPLLALNARGNAVRLLQQKLNSSGAAPKLEINGQFNIATEAALKAFQTGVALPATGTTTPATWVFLDGEKPETAPGLLAFVTEFMQRTVRPYKDLVAICETQTFNPQGAAIRALNTTDVIWSDVENLAASGFAVPNPAISKGAGVLGLTAPDFVQWLKERFDGLAAGIVIEATGDGCDLADARLRQIDGSVVPSETLVAINRFLRLSGRSGLSISELDAALTALRGIGVTGTTDASLPLALAALLRLRARLKLSIPELGVLCGHIQTGPRSLYTQLFLNRAALALDSGLKLALDESELALTAEKIDAHIPALLAAFRISAEDLELIRKHAGLNASSETLSVSVLAKLYRYALLARALEINIADLLTMLALSSPDPFLASIDQPQRLEVLVAGLDALTGADLGVALIDQLLRHVSRTSSGEPDPEQVSDLAATLHDDQIDLAVEVGSEPGMSIERFQTMLARLVGPEAVDQFVGIVTGAATFTAPYSKAPSAAMITAFAPNVTFEPAQKVIRFARKSMPAGSVVTLGALTDGEKSTLQAAAGLDTDLVEAVNILHARPRQVLADTLAGLSTGTTVAVEVLAHLVGARDVEGKLRFIVESLLPYIHDALARAVIKQQLMSFAGLEAPLLALLVEDASIVTAPGSPDPLSAPLRDLERAGWSGEFFTSTTLTGPLPTEEVESLSYDGASADFRQAAPVGSARWSATFLPRSTGTIVFEVTTNGTPELFWNGESLPAVVSGTRFRFEARSVSIRDRIDLILEWRRTVAAAPTLELEWINGTDARTALPPRRVVPATVFHTSVSALLRLEKAARLLRVIEIEPDLLRHVAANSAAFFSFSLNTVPLARDAASAAAIDAAAPDLFRGLLRVVELARLAPGLRGEQPFAAILDAASVADATKAMATALNWKESDVALFAGASGFNIGLPDVVDGRALLLIRRAVNLTRRVGIGAAELIDWATKPVDEAQSEDIKRSVRAKFDEADWTVLSGGLNDPLREKWREALVSYLLVRLGLKNPNQLFELLFLDTEVSSCVKTTRIRHAISACQTFVQRVQLNLENFDIPGKPDPRTVAPTAIDPKIWEAKKFYRVQEAARKVFLYPERYMKELQRDNKTQLFKQFVGDLGQTEMTPQSVESAFLTYLKGLDEVARLEICGAYAQGYDARTRETVDVVHMIGRTTLGAPYSYYYRRLEADRHWTPWERVPIDIDAVHNGRVEGAHVLPVIWNRRLYVFWPIIEEKPNGRIPASNAMNETPEHREWRAKHDAWQKTHDEWVAQQAKLKKDLDQYRKEKKEWEDGLRALGVVPLPFPKEAPIGTTRADQPEPKEPDSHARVDPDLTHIEVRLAWSEFFDGRWSAKEQSSLVLSATETNAARYMFQAVPGFDGTLAVEFICKHINWEWASSISGLIKIGVTSDANCADCGRWNLSGASGKLKVQSLSFGVSPGQSGGLWIVQPDNTTPMFNTFEQHPSFPGLTFNVGDYLPLNARLLAGSMIQARRKPIKALNRSPSIYRVTAPHHYTQYVLQGPCFYQDFDRTYIVTREWGVPTRQIYNVESYGRTVKLEATLPLVAVEKVDLDSRPRTPLFSEPKVSSDAARQERIYGRAAIASGISRFSETANGVPLTTFFTAPKPADLVARDSAAFSYSSSSPYLSTTIQQEYVWFRNLFHPHVSEFIKRLNRGGVDALLSINTQLLNNDGAGNRFASEYVPTTRVMKPYPQEIVDFGDGAYAGYNWELFFHAPMLMAEIYEAAGMWEEAERCLRYELDPTAGTGATGSGSSTDMFWQFLPFRAGVPTRIQDLLKSLSYTGTDPKILALKASTTTQIAEWERDPFNPYMIGRLRIGAMQKYVAIRWMQHLILRADMLLRTDRPEPINEAVQLLVLAANFAGPHDERIPPRTRRTPHSYNTLKAKLDRFSNALVLLENEFPFSATLPAPSGPAGGGLLGMSEALYFCIPPNDLLETLRDTIADRLFKIRHCMNIDGVVRDLPMYDPPIDPALLVAARAQGVDLASVLSDLNAPRPHDRFATCLEHAQQAVEDVRRLGQDLRVILESRDAEKINVTRARQDLLLLRNQMRQVKQRQVDEAKARIEVLKESERLLSNVRIPYFMRQLGATEVPPPNSLADASVLPSSSETARITALGKARTALADASEYEMAAKMMSAIPTILTGTAGSMGSPVLDVYIGGHMLSLGLGAFAGMKSMLAGDATHQATLAQIRAELERRAEQWSLDLSSAVQERENVGKQMLQAKIGLELAEFQLEAHDQETDFAEERLEFLENKPTAVPHHEWLHQEVSLLLGQYYQVAFDECKRAQQVYRFDTGDQLTTFVEFGYFDKAHHGLLAGERLGLALRKMARAYRDQDRYDYELSKPVSLALIDPMALISLKTTGSCEFALTESLFDADFPGHFMRRLRHVSVTVPCVTGPYTTVNATLTLLNSRVRTSSVPGADYTERPDDARFVYHQGIMRSIGTSSANDDSGTFRDPADGRQGRFEGYGAISWWRLDLPHETNAIDPMTIMDVIVRVDFWSREGGQLLKNAARKATILPPIDNAARLFSLRHEFADAWYRGIQPADPTALDQVFQIDLDLPHFPFGVRGRGPKMVSLTLLLQVDDIVTYQSGVALQAEVVMTPLLNGAPSGAALTQVATLQSIPSRLGGLPMAQVPLAGKVPLRVQVKFKSADVGLIAPRFIQDVGTGANLRHRLNRSTARDIDLLVTYDTAV